MTGDGAENDEQNRHGPRPPQVVDTARLQPAVISRGSLILEASRRRGNFTRLSGWNDEIGAEGCGDDEEIWLQLWNGKVVEMMRRFGGSCGAEG